jgi:hypothetical protein
MRAIFVFFPGRTATDAADHFAIFHERNELTAFEVRFFSL